jgi:hypothetical protein
MASRVCSFCGSIGHNKATCGFRLFSMSVICEGEDPLSEVVSPKIRTCSYCSCAGHDLRNCLAHKQLTTTFFPTEGTTPVSSHKLIPESPANAEEDFLLSRAAVTVARVGGPVQKSRVARAPLDAKRARQVIQTIDFDDYDEPWIWAHPNQCRPILNRPILNRPPQPTPHNLIFS